jgi:hypothetical protein
MNRAAESGIQHFTQWWWHGNSSVWNARIVYITAEPDMVWSSQAYMWMTSCPLRVIKKETSNL